MVKKFRDNQTVDLDTLSKEREERLPIDPRLMGVSALNQYSTHFSSPRAVMTLGQLSQFIPLNNGEERIVTSGIDRRLSEMSFDKRIPNDANILDVVESSNGEVTIIFHDLEKDWIDFLEIPISVSHFKTFGFNYILTDAFKDIKAAIGKHTVIPKDTLVARTTSQRDNFGWAFGNNLNVGFMTLAETAEDAIYISDVAAEKFKYKRHFTYKLSFGGNIVPLNSYGNEKEYKIFPGVGEYIRDDGVIFAVRDYNEELSPVLMTTKALQDINQTFDSATFFKHGKGKVVKVKVVNSPRSKTTPYYLGTEDQVNKYLTHELSDGNRIEQCYAQYKRGANNGVSPALTRYLVEYNVIKATRPPAARMIDLKYKNEKMNTHTVEITIEVDQNLELGSKLASLDGGKAIVSGILPQKDMPMDASGEHMDVVIHSRSTIARLNLGRLNEGVISRCALNASKHLKAEFNKMGKDIEALSKSEVDNLFNIILYFTNIIDNAQHAGYLKTNTSERRVILEKAISGFIEIYLPLNNEVSSDEIIAKLQTGPYRIEKGPVSHNLYGKQEITEEDIGIYNMYFFLINKTGDDWLSTSIAKTNHYNIPTSLSREDKDTTPWSNTAMKNLSESEAGAYPAYVGIEAIAELMDRTNNIETLKAVGKNILTAEHPTNIEDIVNRDVNDFNGNVVTNTVQHMLQVSGIELDYVKSPDDNDRKEYYKEVLDVFKDS